jgi:hypothetical protein
MGIQHLAVRPHAPERQEYALRLPAFPHGGCVEPDERPSQVSVPSGPVQQAIPRLAPGVEGSSYSPVEPSNSRC